MQPAQATAREYIAGTHGTARLKVGSKLLNGPSKSARRCAEDGSNVSLCSQFAVNRLPGQHACLHVHGQLWTTANRQHALLVQVGMSEHSDTAKGKLTRVYTTNWWLKANSAVNPINDLSPMVCLAVNLQPQSCTRAQDTKCSKYCTQSHLSVGCTRSCERQDSSKKAPHLETRCLECGWRSSTILLWLKAVNTCSIDYEIPNNIFTVRGSVAYC